MHFYHHGHHINVFLANDMNSIKGCVKKNKDESYTIFVNANMACNQQQAVLKHELKHIENGDFDKKCSADLLELYAHKEN